MGDIVQLRPPVPAVDWPTSMDDIINATDEQISAWRYNCSEEEIRLQLAIAIGLEYRKRFGRDQH